MKYFIKHNVIILVIFIIFSSQSIAGNTILPKPKPPVSEEIKKETEKKKEIYPKKKPAKEIPALRDL